MSSENGDGLRFSEEVDEIAPAFVEVQKTIKDPPQGGENPHFQSKYVQLEDLIHAVRPTLSEHGITMVQAPGMRGGNVTVETVLLHESGQWVRSTAQTPTDRPDPQGVGSAVTYLRRYSLAAMLGLAHESDDDANRASAPAKQNGASTTGDDDLTCPECGGPAWDNREDKEAGRVNEKYPNFKCQDRDCDWASWDSYEEVFGKPDEEEVPVWKQPETVKARNQFQVELLNWTNQDRAPKVFRAYAHLSDEQPENVREWLPSDYQRAIEDWSEHGKERLMEAEEYLDAPDKAEQGDLMGEGADA